MILIAVWLKGQDPNEGPSQIYWADGTAATEEDYGQYRDHTYTLISHPDGYLQRIFLPDLSGEAFYDSIERVWTIRPFGKLLQTDLRDPFAHEHEIAAEMSTFPLVYSLTISRTKATNVLH